MSVLWFAIVVLASYRLTRLVTADRITQPVRDFVEVRSQWLGYLVTCDWCLSVWLAPWPLLAYLQWGDVVAVQWVLGLLAVSALVGLLSLVERRLDR